MVPKEGDRVLVMVWAGCSWSWAQAPSVLCPPAQDEGQNRPSPAKHQEMHGPNSQLGLLGVLQPLGALAGGCTAGGQWQGQSQGGGIPTRGGIPTYSALASFSLGSCFSLPRTKPISSLHAAHFPPPVTASLSLLGINIWKKNPPLLLVPPPAAAMPGATRGSTTPIPSASWGACVCVCV